MALSFKEQCIALRKQDKSIIEIMEITGASKSSIYTHIREVPLSTDKLRAIRTASGRRIRPYAVARRGKSSRNFRRFTKWTPQMVLMVAHLIFDGEIRRGGIYNNRSEALVSRVENCMRVMYDFEPIRYKNLRTSVWRISYYNVALGLFLRKKAAQLLREINRMPLNLKREFIRAFFDDEGCMDFRPEGSHRKIRGYQKDIRILKIISTLLHDIGIHSRIVKPNEVVIVGKENLERFEKEINFSRGVYINGNRTNSRWKRSLEKREILRMAIESFEN
jgi:hypothetical protein